MLLNCFGTSTLACSMRWPIDMDFIDLEDYYKQNYDQLVKRASKRMPSIEDAEDAVQEAFTRALKYLPSFNGKSFDNWFLTILSNVCKQMYNANRLGPLSKPMEDCNPQDFLEDEDVVELPDKTLELILAKKKPETKAVVTLRVRYGYTPEDIKLITGLPKPKIYNILRYFFTETKKVDSDEEGNL